MAVVDICMPGKRDLQTKLRFGDPRGGKRKGAGRPPNGPRSSERHKARPELNARHPILVTTRVSKAAGNLRRRRIYHAVRYALLVAGLRDTFRVVHVSIQRTHVHLIVEASSKHALSRGIQGLLISAARHIKNEIENATGTRPRGLVFGDRYHARVLTSPRQCRNAICYVLNNWRRHSEHRSGVARTWLLDPFSSSVNFGGWKELSDSPFLFPIPDTYDRMPTCFPQTWLLRVGWEKHGLIGATEVPGPAPTLHAG
jgi:putative transposase